MTVEHNLVPRAMSLAVHELRTPVTVVSGYLRMLLREQAGPLNEKQKKMLEEADRSCSRLGALVAEMSDFGKLEGGEVGFARQDFDLAALAVELASGLHDAEDRGIHLAVHAAMPVMVTGDRTRIAAAVKALMISTLRERVEPGVVVARCSAGAGQPAWAVLAIGDEAALPELERAASAPPSDFDEWRGGLGLALPVARRVIDAHGGAVWSAGADVRATSALRLPLSASAASPLRRDRQ
jgi:signal transduction histidine kinase